MRLKVISDGTQGGTKVIDAATGKEMKHVLAIRINIDPQHFEAEVLMSKVDLELDNCPTDVKTVLLPSALLMSKDEEIPCPPRSN